MWRSCLAERHDQEPVEPEPVTASERHYQRPEDDRRAERGEEG